MAYRLGESSRVRLPVIVNLDGFYLSFTREPVEIPHQGTVEHFLQPFDPGDAGFPAGAPRSQAMAVLGGTPYSYFRYQSHLASLNGLEVYEETAAAFEREFGRSYPAIEAYQCQDAEFVFIMMGSFATNAKEAVDRLREAGRAVGLLRPRLLRPFPADDFQRLLKGKKGAAVIDQNLSLGKGGVLHSEVSSVLYGKADGPRVLLSFIGGLGGREISSEEFHEMLSLTQKAALEGKTPPPRLLYTRQELDAMRRLQTIADPQMELTQVGG